MSRSEEHTSELQSRQYLHSCPTRRSSDLICVLQHGSAGKRLRQSPPWLRSDLVQIRLRLWKAASRQFLTAAAQPAVSGRAQGGLLSRPCAPLPAACQDRKSTRLNSSHANIYTLALHDALPI